MDRDGFVVVATHFFDALGETADLRAWTEALEQAPEQPGRALGLSRGQPHRAGRRVIQRIENFCPAPPRLRSP